jgi:hypothetical protein
MAPLPLLEATVRGLMGLPQLSVMTLCAGVAVTRRLRGLRHRLRNCSCYLGY